MSQLCESPRSQEESDSKLHYVRRIFPVFFERTPQLLALSWREKTFSGTLELEAFFSGVAFSFSLARRNCTFPNKNSKENGNGLFFFLGGGGKSQWHAMATVFILCCSLQQPLLFSLPRSSVDLKDPIRGLIFMAVVAGKERRGKISEHAGYGGGLNGLEELLFPEKNGRGKRRKISSHDVFRRKTPRGFLAPGTLLASARHFSCYFTCIVLNCVFFWLVSQFLQFRSGYSS